MSADLIAERVTVPVRRVSKEAFPDNVREHVKEGIFVTMGAGDIDRFIPVFAKMFNQ